jgi:transposase
VRRARACTELNAVYRRLLKMALEELRLIDEQIGQLDQEMASLLSQHRDAVERLAEVPGLGVDSARQIPLQRPSVFLRTECSRMRSLPSGTSVQLPLCE